MQVQRGGVVICEQFAGGLRCVQADCTRRAFDRGGLACTAWGVDRRASGGRQMTLSRLAAGWQQAGSWWCAGSSKHP